MLDQAEGRSINAPFLRNSESADGTVSLDHGKHSARIDYDSLPLRSMRLRSTVLYQLSVRAGRESLHNSMAARYRSSVFMKK